MGFDTAKIGDLVVIEDGDGNQAPLAAGTSGQSLISTGPGTLPSWGSAVPAGAPITVTGAKAGNTALASLITGLHTLGLVTDSTT